jgi:hypothetical protein
VIGRCRFDTDLRPVRIKLVGQNRCDSRIGALPELDVLADDSDGVMGCDPQKGIRCELASQGRSRAFWHRKIEADDQTGGYRALEKLPAIGGEHLLHGSTLQTSRGIMNGGADAVTRQRWSAPMKLPSLWSSSRNATKAVPLLFDVAVSSEFSA